MKQITIEEITQVTKEEAERKAREEYDIKYKSHLVPIYIVVRTDEEGRISSHTYPSCVPMGVQLVDFTSEDKE